MSIIEKRWMEFEVAVLADIDADTRKKLRAVFLGGAAAATEAIDSGVATSKILIDLTAMLKEPL